MDTYSCRLAKSVTGIPCGPTGEDGFYAEVGKNFPYHDKSAPIIGKITITDDLPGMYCNLERVRVYSFDDVLLWEGPLHNLEGVRYV